jgi:hypothetical protein
MHLHATTRQLTCTTKVNYSESFYGLNLSMDVTLLPFGPFRCFNEMITFFLQQQQQKKKKKNRGHYHCTFFSWRYPIKTYNYKIKY